MKNELDQAKLDVKKKEREKQELRDQCRQKEVQGLSVHSVFFSLCSGCQLKSSLPANFFHLHEVCGVSTIVECVCVCVCVCVWWWCVCVCVWRTCRSHPCVRRLILTPQ